MCALYWYNIAMFIPQGCVTLILAATIAPDITMAQCRTKGIIIPRIRTRKIFMLGAFQMFF